jgi:hypothetical protein
MARIDRKVLREWLFPAWPSILMLLVFALYWGVFRDPTPTTTTIELFPTGVEEAESVTENIAEQTSLTSNSASELERFQLEEKKVQLETPAMPIQELRSLAFSPLEKSALDSLESRFIESKTSAEDAQRLQAEIETQADSRVQALGMVELGLPGGKQTLLLSYEVFRKTSEADSDSLSQPVCWRMRGKFLGLTPTVLSEISCSTDFRIKDNLVFLTAEALEASEQAAPLARGFAIEVPFKQAKESVVEALSADTKTWIIGKVAWQFLSRTDFQARADKP